MIPAIQFFDTSTATSELEISESGFEFWLVQGEEWALPSEATYFGYVFQGEVALKSAGAAYPLREGMYFSAPGEVQIQAPQGKALVVAQSGYRGLFSLGGPIESEGRLRYIDGCSDTLLLPPVVMGDACLNFLKIPPGTDQTSHTHPSFRFGMIVDGAGYCDTPAGSERLHAGKGFYIPRDGEHRFRTEEESLSVIAFHPDSDFGPQDDNHPMVNKTIVNGISASKLSHQQRGITIEGEGS